MSELGPVPTISLGQKTIGGGTPPFIVAEMSGNHNGDIQRAIAIVEAAAEAGADAIKLQTYTADTITLDHDGPGFVIEAGPWKGRRLYDLYEEAHTPWDWHPAIFEKAQSLGLVAFSAPFDPTSVKFLESLEAPLYKIASPEIVDLPLIERVARTGKPMIMSTGMANWNEIGEAISAARDAGCEDLVILHCVSAYPTPPCDANLAMIPELAARYQVAAGLSDHSTGTAISVAATALGATVIEKHLTLSRADGGVDSEFSLEPTEFATLVAETRAAFEANGRVFDGPVESEGPSLPFRRSLYAVNPIPAGEAFSSNNVRAIRPAFGLPPKHLPEIIGRQATRDIERGEPLSWSLIN